MGSSKYYAEPTVWTYFCLHLCKVIFKHLSVNNGIRQQEHAQWSLNQILKKTIIELTDDHSRVKLLPTEDDEEGSDYINANYMPVSN